MTLNNLLDTDANYTERLRIPENRTWLKKAAALFAHSGDSWFWGVGLVLLWFFGPQTWRPQIALLFLGIFFTAITVLIIKFTVKRPRPESDWGQIYRSSDPHSFPSGHAARATMLAVIILLSGFWALGLIMVVWALLVQIARVGLGVHYLSDILVGSLIGIVMGVLAVWVYSLF